MQVIMLDVAMSELLSGKINCHYSETSNVKNLIVHQTNTWKIICYQMQSAM